jgi:porin
VNVFALATAAPADRNFSSLFIEAGLVWVGPRESRDADILSLGVAYTNLSHAQQTLGSDLVRFGSATKAFRGGETVIELTYQAAVTKWLLVQPDVQYIINPGAGVPTVASNGQVLPLKDAVAAGVRATIIF